MQPPAPAFGDHDSGAGNKHKEDTAQVHQQSASKSAHLHPEMADTKAGPSSGSQRNNTAGKSFTQSLKRRFGSFRKKKTSSDDVGY